MKIKIVVNEEDINNGKRGSGTNCPIALAVKRLCPDAFKVYVQPFYDEQSGSWWAGNAQSFQGDFGFNLPKDIAEKADKFDREGLMEPFEFEISI